MTSALCCVICHDCDPMLRFFHVPNKPERLQEWSDLLNIEINYSSIICEKHFLAEHISKNLELNCCRLNKKAIPTLHLTEEDIGGITFTNESDFDKNNDFKQNGSPKKECNTKGTQTKKFSNVVSQFSIKCLWCEDSFVEPGLQEILMHLKSKHLYDVELFFEENKILAPSSYDDTEENTLDVQGDNEIDENSDIGENYIEESSPNGSISIKSEDNEEEFVDETDMNYPIEEFHVKNEFVVDSDPVSKDQGNIDEVLRIQTGSETMNNMLPIGEVSNNQVNMETSDPVLIFFIIDLLKTIPTIWFINCFKSKEYEAGFTDFCRQFSDEYQHFMTQNELHDSLIEMREWYIKIFEEKTFDELPFPQSEYYEKLAEFLPDKPDGKTCEFCGSLFYDHIQYYGHKKLEHDMPDDVDDDVNAKSILKYLRINSEMYYYARYPLRQGGFSYDCQVCPAKSYHKREFFEHIKKHLDIRDHVCDVCGKTFVKRSRFVIHQNRHRGTHKFPCKICGKEFTNGSLLTNHRKNYHRPIEGTIEELELRFSKKRFRGKRTGILVTYSAADKKLIYTCRLCDKTYKNPSGAYKHRKLFHPEIILEENKSKKQKYSEEHIEETEESVIYTDFVMLTETK